MQMENSDTTIDHKLPSLPPPLSLSLPPRSLPSLPVDASTTTTEREPIADRCQWQSQCIKNGTIPSGVVIRHVTSATRDWCGDHVA